MARVYEIQVGSTRYIGHTKNPGTRILQHITNLESGTHWLRPLQEAYDQQGNGPEGVRFRFLTKGIPLEEAQEQEARRVSEDPSLVNVRKFPRREGTANKKRLAQVSVAEDLRAGEEQGASLRELASRMGISYNKAWYLARKVWPRND